MAACAPRPITPTVSGPSSANRSVAIADAAPVEVSVITTVGDGEVRSAAIGPAGAYMGEVTLEGKLLDADDATRILLIDDSGNWVEHRIGDLLPMSFHLPR